LRLRLEFLGVADRPPCAAPLPRGGRVAPSPATGAMGGLRRREAPEGVRGFLVTLEHKGRSYLYRAEGDTVQPCPDGDAAKPR